MKNFSILHLMTLALLLASCAAIHLTPSKEIFPLTFTEDLFNSDLQFVYLNSTNNPESDELKQTYDIEAVSAPGEDAFEKALLLMNWTNSRWKHSGSNKPSDARAMTILAEAEEGQKFRCVEYGIVLRSVLSVIETPARTLGLKSRDVEETRLGAGHVAAEAWSEVHRKWFFMDAQFNVVPVLDSVPLNAVEFQEAIVSEKDFQLIDVNGEVDEKRRKKYLKFIAKYLYFFDFRFDQRDLPYEEMTLVYDKEALMLVPLEAENPEVFQRNIKMDHLVYTHSLTDFYSKP
ncbi:MAG: hypothetical protein AAF804_07360 [Bacteroidota bacterium]